MSESASAPPQPQERRSGFIDGQVILTSISTLSDNFVREMRDLKTTVNNWGEKHQGLHMEFARHETEVRVRMTALEKAHVEIWNEVRATQINLGKTQGEITNHVTVSAASKETKKGIGENAKWLFGILFGGGLVFVIMKLFETRVVP